MVLCISISSCRDEFVEVPSNPNLLDKDKLYLTAEGVRAALNSCYTPPVHGGWYGKGYQLLYGSFDDRYRFESTRLDEFLFFSDAGEVEAFYEECYRLLFRTASFLENVESCPDPSLSATEKRALKGTGLCFKRVGLF